MPLPKIEGLATGGTAGPAHPGFCLDDLSGRLVELAGGADTAVLTLVTGVLLEAQLRGEPVAWVATGATTFFPPDLAASGIDLAALPVIQVEKGLPVLRAADALLRSGSFGVVVLDLGEQVSMTLAVQTRLVGLARRFATALIALTRSRNHPQRTRGPRSQSRANSLGSLVSLRAACTHRRTDFDRFTCELHALKDKRRGPGWRHTEVCRGPNGLC